MASGLVGLGNGTNVTVAPGNTGFFAIGAGQLAIQTTEVLAQIEATRAMTFSNLSLNVRSNTLTTASVTVRFRKNGADGNQVVTFSAGSTGEVIDSTNSDSVDVGDLYNLSISVDAGGTGVTNISQIFVECSSDGRLSIVLCATGNGVITTAAGIYGFFASNLVNAAGSAGDKRPVQRGSGTYSDMQIYVDTNTNTNSFTLKSFKNGAAGGMTITVPAGATGLFKASSGSDAVVNGDTYQWEMIGSGTVNYTYKTIDVRYEPENEGGFYNFPLVTGQSSSALSLTNTSDRYMLLTGLAAGGITAAASTQYTFPFDCTIHSLDIYLSANAATGDRVVVLQKGGVDQALTTTITASTAGLFSDVVNSVAVTAGDVISLRIGVGGTGNSSLRWISLWVRVPVDAVASNMRQPISRLNLGLGLGLTRYA